MTRLVAAPILFCRRNVHGVVSAEEEGSLYGPQTRWARPWMAEQPALVLTRQKHLGVSLSARMRRPPLAIFWGFELSAEAVEALLVSCSSAFRFCALDKFMSLDSSFSLLCAVLF